ncbi:MAG: putative amidohydrolase YtcJ [Halieaceae bacterium]|jgi:predicted amidohydrolase YtcJ
MKGMPTLWISALLCIASSSAFAQIIDPADAIFSNGRIYTMAETPALASAVAIKEGKIVYVGDSAGALALAGAHTRVVDLAGRMMLPGFHDVHAHILAGGMSLSGCSLGDIREQEGALQRLRVCATDYAYEEGEWVIGAHWALAAFEDGNPRKEWLDEVFGDRPAYFVDTFSHSAWVSSRALAMAGISAETPDPPQGVIERDPLSGEPTGTLRDAAMALVEALIPPPSAEDFAAGIRRGLQEAHRFGVTAYIEPGLNPEQTRVYAALDERGELTARVVGSLSPLAWDAGKTDERLFEQINEQGNIAGPHFRTGSVKIYIDGVLETRTSHMLAPYDDGSNFPPFYAREILLPLYARLHAMGIQIHTHAIGDGAIRLALDAYEHARDEAGPLDDRHHIVHLQLIDQADIPRFGELGVAASFQGVWLYPDEYIEVAAALVGEARVQQFYPAASVEDSGGLLVGGSDWDVSTLNPLHAIETLLRRQDPESAAGPTLGEGQEISLESALRSYTRNAAHLMKLEALSGSIEVGKQADLIVLDRDLFAIPLTAISDARVLLTLVDGKAVFSDAEFAGGLSAEQE